MRLKTGWLLLLPLFLRKIHASIDQSSSVSVEIRNGTVIGINDESSQVQRFLGIPYAQSPVGDLRLRQSIPLNTTFGALKTLSFGPACYGPDLDSNPNSSEDCLTLNIWRGSRQNGPDALKPVMVWFYGGGLQTGYTADPRFEGTNIVRISADIGKEILLVSVNYRLGPLGFLNGQQMADLDLLNLGMLDQRLALHWIQENIAAFGGDPGKVTIAGESAGAVSVYSHTMAYGGRDDNLFRAGILESGGSFPLTYANTSSFQETFDSLITSTTCTSVANASTAQQLDCIRQLPIETFLSSVGSSTGQSIDGGFTQTSLQFALEAGKYVKVATIVGTNTDEGTNSAPTGVNTTEQLWGPLADGFHRPVTLPNKTVADLLYFYPDAPEYGCPYNTGNIPLTPGTLDKKACSIFGGIVQIAPARMITQTLSRNSKDGDPPIYRYRFNHLPSDTEGEDMAAGVGTGVEQGYVFSNLVPEHPWDQALAEQVSRVWVSFVHGLNPNFEDSTLPKWPQYGDDGKSMVFSGYGSSIEEDNYRAEAVDYIIENVLPYGAL
ncbi:Alpha/Beta hydrolase protein [Aspergillus stella-maris]|uniref:Alpha/Beta hydrolase protein n=1 Tax=Aspergillus stella-maris TaxID=1810926 RepID=UPI003CCDBF04